MKSSIKSPHLFWECPCSGGSRGTKNEPLSGFTHDLGKHSNSTAKKEDAEGHSKNRSIKDESANIGDGLHNKVRNRGYDISDKSSHSSSCLR